MEKFDEKIIFNLFNFPFGVFNTNSFKFYKKNKFLSTLLIEKNCLDNTITSFFEKIDPLQLKREDTTFDYNLIFKKIKNYPFRFCIKKLKKNYSILFGMDILEIKEKELIVDSYYKVMEDYNKIKEKQINASLEMASSIQKSLLPRPNANSNFFSISSFYQAAVSIGGDWYNYYLDDDKAHIYIGDITGHGIAPALLAGVVTGVFEKHLLNTLNEKIKFPDPNIILNDFNQIILKLSNQQLVMTMLGVTILHSQLKLNYYSAGHTPLLILKMSDCKPDGDFDIKLIANSGSKLGYSNFLNINEQVFQISKNDVIFVYTDGIIEGISNGQEFGLKRLKNLLKKHFKNNLSLDQTMKNIKEEIIDSFDSKSLDDDLSAVAIKLL